MASMTAFLANTVIDHLLRGQAYTPPATVYLALFTDATTEVAGGSYARQPLALSAGSGGASANTDAITFPNMPACTVTRAKVMDALTAGNALMTELLTSPKAVTAGDSFSFAAGDVDVSFG